MGRVLITGLSGFVGTALARRLLAQGDEVVGIVRDINSAAPVLQQPECHILVGDVCDYDCVSGIVSYYEIDTVYHFAANAIVRVSARDPVSTYRVNVMGTVNVLEACRVIGGVRSIVVASSDKAYGDHDVLPYTEAHELRPKNTYDTSKACMDMVARSYASNYDMPVIVTRCSNVYGPGDTNVSRIVPNTINRILRGKRPEIYSDVADMRREFIFIDDVVEAYCRLRDLRESDVFNIGGTGETSILDLVDMIAVKMDMEPGQVDIVTRDSRFREIGRQSIDASKLTARTGWLPQVSLGTGIERSIDWYASYFRGIYL